MKKNTAKQLAFTGIMAALVYVTSAFLQIQIPTAIGSTRLHMGNVMCLLSGLLLGPVQGGLAAGIGTMFYDLMDPAFVAGAPFTFAFKFIMAYIAGVCARSGGAQSGSFTRNLIGCVLGEVAYIILYLGKSFISSYYLQKNALYTKTTNSETEEE